MSFPCRSGRIRLKRPHCGKESNLFVHYAGALLQCARLTGFGRDVRVKKRIGGVLACLLLGALISSGCARQEEENTVENLAANAQAGDVNARAALEEAAVQGDAGARFVLGMLYAYGTGVRQDYAQARLWFEEAAALGHAEAQHKLGEMYARGWGVRQDMTKALVWYEKAAERGASAAQFELGVMYEYGRNVPQDKARAREWYDKACVGGFQPGCKAREKLDKAAQ